MKRAVLPTAAIAAAVFLLVVVTLPPRRASLPAGADGTVPGIIHVHSSRSDGLSGPDEIAAAAARAGVKFLVFTDHGDATRVPDPPIYRSGVLCLDGVEVSTTGGHYVAIDMPAAPYPLGGDPRSVVEDVRRLGGFGIVAHPDSPKAELQWRDWDVPFDGVELLNPDTSWRVLAAQPGWRSKVRLLSAFFHYPFRAPEVMTSLIQPTRALEAWATAARQRRVVSVAGADAHAKLALRNADPGDSRLALPLPGYEPSFRVLSIHARLDRPWSGQPASDAAVLMRAIRNGHVYSAVDGLAGPPSFDFTATNSRGTVRGGDELGLGGPVTLSVRSNAPSGFTTILHDGVKTIASVRDRQEVSVEAPEAPAVYWAEIVAGDRLTPLTWIRSNAVYVRDAVTETPVVIENQEQARRELIVPSSPTGGARLELPRSRGDLGLESGGAMPVLRFNVALDEGVPSNQAAALVFDTPNGVADADRVAVELTSDRPMRLSLQLRSADGDSSGDRWVRSLYADSSWRAYSVRFDDLTPVGVVRTARPPLDRIRSVMLVVDLTNTKPGFASRIRIRNFALVR